MSMLINRHQLAEIGRCLTLVAVTLLLAACAAVPPAPTLVVAQLAPNGTLRAAINYGNPLLAKRDADGAPRGVSVDLARELGRRLGVPVELVTYTAAGKMVAGIQAGEWDVAFYAIDPVRAVDTEFSAPYLLIEGAYLVPDASPIRRSEDVDREGVRVAAAKGSAYDLYLTRSLKHATLVHAPTSQQVTETLLGQKLEVAAGVRQQMQADAARLPGLRLLDGRFMEIRQAMAVPTGRRLGAAYVAKFVEQMKASGFIAESLHRHGIEGVTLAEPAPGPIR
jgi:polar amino acid transport system substrate-binding protein